MRIALGRIWLFPIRFVVILVDEVRLVILFLFEAIIGHRAALAPTRRHRLVEGKVGGRLSHFVVVGLGHRPAAVETTQERLKCARETQKLSKEKQFVSHWYIFVVAAVALLHYVMYVFPRSHKK